MFVHVFSMCDKINMMLKIKHKSASQMTIAPIVEIISAQIARYQLLNLRVHRISYNSVISEVA